MRSLLVTACLVVALAGCGMKRDLGNAETTRKQIEAQLGIDVPHVVIKVTKADVAGKESRTVVVTVPRAPTTDEQAKADGIARAAFEVPVDRIEYEICSPSAECPKPEGT